MIARGSTIRTALLEKARTAALPPRQTYEVLAPIQSRSEVIHRFNLSLIRFAGRWLMAYRVGRVQSRIALAELDDAFRPLCETLIELPSHAEARDGQEDPRLFLFRGDLWLSYTGLARPRNTIMLARITPDGAVLEHLVPDFPARQLREKNWVFFESGGELHAVYHGAPHRVLRVVGGKAELLPGESRQFTPPTAFPWPLATCGAARHQCSRVASGTISFTRSFDRNRIDRCTAWAFTRLPIDRPLGSRGWRGHHCMHPRGLALMSKRRMSCFPAARSSMETAG